MQWLLKFCLLSCFGELLTLIFHSKPETTYSTPSRHNNASGYTIILPRKLQLIDFIAHTRQIKLNRLYPDACINLTNQSFCRNPTPEPDPLLDNVTWPQVKPNKSKNVRYLEINSDLTIHQALKPINMDFWSRLYEQFGHMPFDTY